ncbi:uncharacterized protein DUF3883 [Asanoa ferruginea]|uniref:Uncharacterized protein DUF3883 n=1 Tax=Asanoa ferruginea TaxID=53367 RepID=A0A3D9ZGH9_9ACTN|nr:DUF3883 domain-containing protein [Asanoa ferruginea]REF95959.1 uncharacterized protein DUF3883 [Asanoa ferruginea]GIF52464.1 hypothetical protein Afe04nite_70030 [Asanoa ferruginea]
MTQIEYAASEQDAGLCWRRIENKTQGRIRSYLDSKDSWNLSRSLKNLIEQAVRDYEHRALVELVQNAHDAHDPGDRAGRILVRLDYDEGDHGVVYVANTGCGFTDSNFDAISDIAQSDKRLEEGIGNKGIGFKSVLQLSRTPEVYSTAEDPRQAYCFRFATVNDVRGQLEKMGFTDGVADISAEVERDVFHLCLPIPQPHRPAPVDALLSEGYVTVVRLPLRNDEGRVDAAAQLSLLNQTPPTLLFLRRIAELTIETTREQQTARSVLHRHETHVADLVAGVTVSTVDLGRAGTYLVADKAVAADTFNDAIRRSIAGDHISEGWEGWRGDAHISIAARLDTDLAGGRLYTYLPMGQDAHAPLHAHVNAPFFAKLARVSLEQSIPLNDTLLNEIAALCAEILLAASSAELTVGSDTVVDLLSWTAAGADRLKSAFTQLGHDVATALVVPVHGHGPNDPRSSLSQVYTWDDGNRTVLTTGQLAASAHAPLLPTTVSKQRVKRLEVAAQLLANRRLTPTGGEIADWAEQVAHALASEPFDPDMWGNFYDDLASVRPVVALQGRKILIDDDRKLRPCNGGKDNNAAIAFFSPKSDIDAASSADDDLKPPPSLRRRLFFVSSDIPWNRRTGAVTSKRTGRRMLEDGLVREYRATDLLPVIGGELARRQTLASDVLLWTFRFAISRDDPPWQDISRMGLLVPCRDGRWLPAAQAYMSKLWGGDDVTLLDDLLNRTRDESADMADVDRRLIVGPNESPFREYDRKRMRDFLVAIGVRTGLRPEPVPDSTLRAEGRVFEHAWLEPPATLTEATAGAWLRKLRRDLPNGLRPYTFYLSRTPLYRLAGQDDHDRFPPLAKFAYARLIAHGLASWPDETLTVVLRRHSNPADSFSLPTPVAAFLVEEKWLPISAPGERTKYTYDCARNAWSHSDDAPPFASVIASQVRRLLNASPRAEARIRGFGVRSWDDRATAADRVLLLAHLLEAGQVPPTVLPQFRAAYEDAWVTAVSETPRGSPLDGASGAPVVVTRGATLQVIDIADPSFGGPLFVQDVDERQRLQLLEYTDHPVLRLRHSAAGVIAGRLIDSFGARVRRVSDLKPTVRVDSAPFTPSADSPLLVQPEHVWLVDLVAAVIELRLQRVRSAGPDALRRLITRLRRIRLVTAASIEASIDADVVAAAMGGTRYLAVNDDEYPTVLVVPPQGGNYLGLLARATPAIGELLAYPGLGDALRVALSELDEAGYGLTQTPSSFAIAAALGEPVKRVEEVRAAIRRPDEISLEVLVPLVAVFDHTLARQLNAGDETSLAPVDIALWLCTRTGNASPQMLLQSAGEGLDTARRLLGIELQDLNTAIERLGAPYQPLKDPAGIAQQFRHFTSTRASRILDALRVAYLPNFHAGQTLDHYVEHRAMTTLVPDPNWPNDHYPTVPDELMLAQVNKWLTAAGATDLEEKYILEPVEKLLTDNRARVMEWTGRAAEIIRAYEDFRHQAASNLPGDRTKIADAAAATGMLDFEPVGQDRFLTWLASSGRWPTDMPVSVETHALGLPPEALARAQSEQEQLRRHHEQERRTITIDGTPVLADESNYAQIAAAVRASATSEFRNSDGNAFLVERDLPRNRFPSPGRTGTTAARRLRPSDAQMGAIGLAGEIAAIEWLKMNFPGVTELQSWRSGYRNQILGDNEGDDTLGYDLVVDDKKLRIMFEVKSTTGDHAEFQLTDLEIARAQHLKRRERYEILFVTHVLDGERRRIHRLPNPLDPKTSRLYRTVGDGVRYQFTFADHYQETPS